jgi:hypothetical protein
LRKALETQKLSANKAARIASALNLKNARELVAFAMTHRSRETDFEVARLNPKAATRDSAKPVADDLVTLKVSVPKRVYEQLRRAQSVVSQNTGESVGWDQTIEAVLMEYLKRQDPVEKAKRRLASQRKVADQNNVVHENKEGDDLPVQSSAGKHRAKRIRLKARQKHAVHNRDQGRCTYVDANGWQCTNDRWLVLTD